MNEHEFRPHSKGVIDTYADAQVALARRRRWTNAFLIFGTAIGLATLGWVAAGLPRKPAEAVRDEAAARQDSFFFELPDNVKVELIGLTPNIASPLEWWKPDGSPLEPTPEMKKNLGIASMQSGTEELRRCLIHVYGKSDTSSVTSGMTGVHSTTQDGTTGTTYVNASGGLEKRFQQTTTEIRIGIATESLSPTRILDANGQRLPAVAGDPPDHIREDILVTKVVAEQGGKGTELYYQIPSAWRSPDLRMVAIDKSGKRHQPNGFGGGYPTNAGPKTSGVSQNWRRFSLPSAQIERFEYQFRIHRHWVTFENVSLDPGRKTKVRITGASID